MPSAVQAVQATIAEARRLGALDGPGGARLARQLLDDLQEADRQLSARLRRLRAAGLGNRFSGAQAVMFQAQVREAIAAVREQVDGMRERTSRQAAGVGLRHSTDLLEALERRFAGIVQPLRMRQAVRLVPAVERVLGARARFVATSLDRYGSAMVEDFERILRAGLLTGASTQDVIDALTGHGGPRGLVSLAARVTPEGVLRIRESDIPEGLFARHRSWAERLVRTEMAAAYNGAKLEAMREEATEFPDLGKKILAVLDDRTALDSIYVHGQVRPLDGLFEDGAGRLYQHPPARPNDRETIIPWRLAWSTGPSEGQRPLTAAERALLDPESLSPAERARLLRAAGPDAAARARAAGETLSEGATRTPAPPPVPATRRTGAPIRTAPAAPRRRGPP